ncbi:unnamed protein product [Caenorhabditis angaria]|uniref:Uncharacterized protein n=1 Tax=Caenorhabditis angaria TaxID=860376 RepID=A0A9P1IBR7_9PELO|nr:unnamed protein product [Caenorhabditis angaria]
MDIFNEESFLDEIRNKMPSKLLALVIFGNYIPLKKWKRLKEIKTFLIIFGPNESIASCPQANLTNIKLLSHLVRRPPYNPSRSFLSPLDMTIENISWRFSLVDWQTQNTAPPTIPPDRLLIQDDVEDPIRFLRRLNRFADHNTLLPAAPPQHIPLANQTAPRQTRQIRSTSAPQRTAQGNVRRRVSHERDRRLQSTPNRTDSMQTHPPTPPVSTIQMSQRTPIIQEITANSTVGTMNRGFVQSANTSNVSEMTMSPERINPVVTVVPNRGSRIEPNNEGTQMIVETLANNIDMIIPSEQNNSQNNQQATRNTVPPPPRD